MSRSGIKDDQVRIYLKNDLKVDLSKLDSFTEKVSNSLKSNLQYLTLVKQDDNQGGESEDMSIETLPGKPIDELISINAGVVRMIIPKEGGLESWKKAEKMINLYFGIESPKAHNP